MLEDLDLGDNMKVYFISSGYDGCFMVRCVLPMLANGWNGQWKGKDSIAHNQEQLLQGVQDADVIVFQRPMTDAYYDLARVLKKMGKKIVYDNDDTYIPNSGTPMAMTGFASEEQIKEFVTTIDNNLKRFAELADLITVSTDFLAKEYPPEKTVTLKNCVDIDLIQEIKKNTTDKVRIGIQGSVLYSEDYKIIKTVIEDLSKRDDVTIVVFGLPPDTEAYKIQRESMYKETIDWVNSINAEWHPVVHITEYMERLNDLRLDMLLIPRVDNYFNRAKSNLKFLESSLLEIPCVCSSFEDNLSPYEVNREDTKHLILCKTENEWKYFIDKLIENKEYREKLGKDAREYIIKNYNIKDNAHLWADAYKKLCQ